ncbi:MAG: phosphotransferase [Ilumatobacteraceae bacterium]
MLTGGETGATEIRSASGVRRVLKWDADPDNVEGRRRGARMAQRLHDAGWPVPAQDVRRDGPWLFVAQELMPGHDVRRVDTALVHNVLDLHPKRLGLGDPADAARWGTRTIQLLVSGGNGYCLHEPLRTYDHRTRRLLDRIRRIGVGVRAAQLSGNDIVHADLHPGNLLQSGGRLSAVIDVDYATSGDAAFDLTFFAITSLQYDPDEATRRLLREVGLGPLDAARRQTYVAATLLQLLDWAIRKRRTDEIELWLSHSGWLFGDDR